MLRVQSTRPFSQSRRTVNSMPTTHEIGKLVLHNELSLDKSVAIGVSGEPVVKANRIASRRHRYCHHCRRLCRRRHQSS